MEFIERGFGMVHWVKKKENNWIVDGIKKSEFLSLGFAKITAEGLNTKNLVTNT